MADLRLATRSLFWTVLFPGTIAGYVPWRFFGLGAAPVDAREPRTLLALLVVAAGTAILVATVWQFAHDGRGTLSPVDPPRTLVVRGLYRWVRNPMYLGVTLVLLGEALLAWRVALVIYWATWFAAVNLFVMAYEEPHLRAQFGESYERYTREVGRWIPRRPRSARRAERGVRE
jgi:protein-S-isoprenylcysteine O-methyltransferase Ste14